MYVVWVRVVAVTQCPLFLAMFNVCSFTAIRCQPLACLGNSQNRVLSPHVPGTSNGFTAFGPPNLPAFQTASAAFLFRVLNKHRNS